MEDIKTVERTATITINSEQPKPTTFEDLGYVQVVRCKDCKWFIKKFVNEGRCIKHENDFHDPEWFCADGKQRE